MHSFACQYFFFIAILKGEPRRFEPRPHLKASRQTQLKFFFYLLLCMSASMVEWLQCWYPAQAAQVQVHEYSHIFFPLASTIKSFVFIICITFLLLL
jgi:hypothetical protein